MFGNLVGAEYETLLATTPLDLPLPQDYNCLVLLPDCESIGAFFPWPAATEPASTPVDDEQWATFSNPNLRLSFDHPAGCEVMQQRNVARIGERVTLVEFDGEMIFIERGESVLRVAFEPVDGPCGFEPRIYARILATLRFVAS